MGWFVHMIRGLLIPESRGEPALETVPSASGYIALVVLFPEPRGSCMGNLALYVE